MRPVLCLTLLGAVLPLQVTAAQGTQSPDSRVAMTDDGYWKIDARTQGGDNRLAIDVALYRAAELARAAGQQYIEMHDGYSRRNTLGETAILFARAADAPVHPDNCRSGRARRCYTADVLAVIRQLSGPSGREPGVAVPTSVDEYGRTVTRSGFGIGAVTSR